MLIFSFRVNKVVFHITLYIVAALVNFKQPGNQLASLFEATWFEILSACLTISKLCSHKALVVIT